MVYYGSLSSTRQQGLVLLICYLRWWYVVLVLLGVIFINLRYSSSKIWSSIDSIV